MEFSTDCSMNRVLCSASSTSDQESGWTFYFDDFLASDQNEAGSSSVATSMVSDASSPIPEKYTAKAEQRLKKRKAQAMGVSNLEDDSLEDTACSPVRRPKVGGMGGGRDVCKEVAIIEENCAELKKRGMCLIPLSMVVDFFAK